MKRLPIFTIIFALLASLIAGMTIPVGAESSNPEQRDPQVTIAEIYSKHFGVTVDEALHRLSLQDAFPDLGPELEKNEAETFGGLWIQHEPEYKIVVAFTRDGAKTIAKYSNYIPAEVAPYIEVRIVDKSLAELQIDQEKLFSSLNQQGIKIESRVDIRNNCVSIDIVNKDKYDLAVKDGKVAIPDKLKINLVDSLSILQTDIYGGLTLDYYSYSSPYLTSGFSVHNSSTGADGIITAGHADNVTLYYSGQGLSYQSESLGGSYDVQWHTASGVSFPNKIQWWSDGSTFNITSVKSRSQQNVGDIISKYGMTTHYTAGEISSKIALLASPYNSATWMEVENVFGYQKLSDAGDSGGPWFSGNTALGIHHGGYADGSKAFYMALDYLDLLGVSVKTY